MTGWWLFRNDDMILVMVMDCLCDVLYVCVYVQLIVEMKRMTACCVFLCDVFDTFVPLSGCKRQNGGQTRKQMGFGCV